MMTMTNSHLSMDAEDGVSVRVEAENFGDHLGITVRVGSGSATLTEREAVRLRAALGRALRTGKGPVR